MVRLPSSGKVAVCGVRPEDTMDRSVAASPVADSLGIGTPLMSCSGAPCPGYNESILVPRIDATAQPAAATHRGRLLLILHLLLPACTAGRCRYLSGSLPARTRVSIARISTQRCESPPLPTLDRDIVFEIQCPVCDQLVNNCNPHFDVQAFCAIAYVAGCSRETVSDRSHRYRSHT